MPKLVPKNRIEPPAISSNLRGTVWVRGQSVKPVTGNWTIDMNNIPGTSFLSLLDTFRVLKIRVFLYDITASLSPTLQIFVRNDPQSAAGIVFSDRGIGGVSYAQVEIDLARSWKSRTWNSQDTESLITIQTATLGAVLQNIVQVDVLLEINKTLSSVTSILASPSPFESLSGLSLGDN